jgi:hypothetical protein
LVRLEVGDCVRQNKVSAHVFPPKSQGCGQCLLGVQTV